jgi:hypothetical protein
MELYEVVSPVGRSFTTVTRVAPRLDTLAGKTICEVSNGDTFRCPQSYPIIREALLKRFPGANIVPYTELPISEVEALGPEKKEATCAALRAAYKEKKCDAVISQLGG